MLHPKANAYVELDEKLQQKVYLCEDFEGFSEVLNCGSSEVIHIETGLCASHMTRTEDTAIDKRQNPLHVKNDIDQCANFETNQLQGRQSKSNSCLCDRGWKTSGNVKIGQILIWNILQTSFVFYIVLVLSQILY